jgi:phytoene dehydrogenase-like protein
MAGLANHRTPVRGLYHIGASNHPGPGLHGTSGLLLAKALLGEKRVRVLAR